MTNLLSLNANKAGLSSLDDKSKDEISRKIQEASKDTAFFKHQIERQKKIDLQIKRLFESASKLSKDEREKARKEMDRRADELRGRYHDYSHIIVHLDMDMFFAAVEIRDDPSLADVPVAVGSKSMISTSNYVARKFGVRAGMAGFIGLKLCPQLKIIPPDFEKYKKCSDEVMDIVAEYDANYYSPSMDEAYLDITECVRGRCPESVSENWTEGGFVDNRVWDVCESVVSEMRQKIVEKTRVTCSCGVGHNKMVAKVCTEVKKPNGQCVLRVRSDRDLDRFLSQTSVRMIPGIGPVQSQHLAGLGISTCKHLFDSRDLVYLLFTPSLINFYLRVSLGIGSHEVNHEWNHEPHKNHEPHRKNEPHRKSVGTEMTFTATGDLDSLSRSLRDLSRELSEELKSRHLAGKTITIRVKWATFESIVRSRSLESRVNDAETLYNVSKSLLSSQIRVRPGDKIRLLGIRVSHFSDDKIVSANLLNFVKRVKKGEETVESEERLETVESEERLETVMDEMPSENETLSQSDSNSCDYLCIYCSNQFSSDSNLELHLRDCEILIRD